MESVTGTTHVINKYILYFQTLRNDNNKIKEDFVTEGGGGRCIFDLA